MRTSARRSVWETAELGRVRVRQNAHVNLGRSGQMSSPTIS